MIQNSGDPKHWDLLCESDKKVYRQIFEALSAPTNRNKRNKKIADFTEVIEAIEIFENTDSTDKWKRCLVCGVCRLSNGIAVNIAQLRRLVLKCKSSINGSLKGMGYDIVLSKPSACEELLKTIPFLRNNPAELRQWTVRLRSHQPKHEQLADMTMPQVDLASECSDLPSVEPDLLDQML